MTIKTKTSTKSDVTSLLARKKSGLNVIRGSKQEYDDENYFTVPCIREVLGMEVEWDHFQVDKCLPEHIAAVKNVVPANSLRLITDKTFDVGMVGELKEVQEQGGWLKYDPVMIDFCIKCLQEGFDLDDALLEVKSRI